VARVVKINQPDNQKQAQYFGLHTRIYSDRVSIFRADKCSGTLQTNGATGMDQLLISEINVK
jgi:hypothetical protein